MKVIELFNKIANKEKVPKQIKIKGNGAIWTFDSTDGDYHSFSSEEYYDDKLFFTGMYVNAPTFLNEEIEVIDNE